MAAYRAGELDRVDGLSAADAVSLSATPGSKLVRYPRATFTTIALNLRPNVTLFQDVHVRTALLEAIDRTKLISTVLSGLGTRADSPIPPKSWAFSLHASKAVAYSTHEAALNLEAAGWHKTAGKWYIGRSTKQVVVELIVPSKATNPVAYATAAFISKSWRSLGVLTHVVALTPAEFVGDRLTTADFKAAVVDINIGLDPDLFPLFASRQAGHGGSNISGVQSLVLDAKLIAARKPGTDAERKAAYIDLQKFLSATQVTLPMFFRDEPVVVSNRVTGGAVRLLGDPSDRFWDVLTWRLAASR
jgi:ABC-type transport system substrate-binding protein